MHSTLQDRASVQFTEITNYNITEITECAYKQFCLGRSLISPSAVADVVVVVVVVVVVLVIRVLAVVVVLLIFLPRR